MVTIETSGSDAAAPEPAPAAVAGLPLLLRIRWLVVVGQLLAWWWLQPVLGIASPGRALAIPLVVGLSNLLAGGGWARRFDSTSVAGALFTLDTVLLTLWLAWSGGVVNPFTILYLVQIALAALVLGPGWTWAITALGGSGFGLLLAMGSGLPSPSPHAAHDSATAQLHLHLRGMWVAFVLAAGLTALFVSGLRRVLDRRDAELARERAERSRSERLAALSTVVGSAAHELATPVATVALAAGEVALRLEREAPALAAELAPELEAMRVEAGRARRILDEMGERVGEARGEGPRPLGLETLVEEAMTDLPPASRERVRRREVDGELVVAVPRQAMVRAIAAVLRNAFDASSEAAEVEVEIRRAGAMAELAVADRGHGMTDAELARVGEPFFTTKPAGRGLGLGLYTAQGTVAQLGGTFELVRRAGGGMRATLRLPLAPGSEAA